MFDTLIRRITRTLIRAAVLVEDAEHPYLDLEPSSALEQLRSASTRYRIAVGPIAGGRTMTLHTPTAVSSDNVGCNPLTVARDGFSLNAAVACEAHQRDKLERICRYVTRPPIALERLSIDGDGAIVYELKHALRDGTTHVLVEPMDFIARLAALVPRPRAHLTRYHELFAPNAKHRHLIVTRQTSASMANDSSTSSTATREVNPTAPMTWMQRLRRVFEIDLRFCPRCGAQLRVLAAITNPRVINAILVHCDARDDGARGPPASPWRSVH